MAKTAKAITVTAILAGIVIVGFGVKMLSQAWSQGQSHGAETAQVQANKDDIAEIKPEVKKNTEARNDIKWIKGSLERIENKL